ncbi:MAG: hypothetical protein ACOYXT_16640 [Bacteroidota bacterium]
MKKLIWCIIFLGALAGGGYLWYQSYLPQMVAEAIVSEQTPAYLPEPVKIKIEKLRKPVNDGAESIIKKMHQSKITLDQVFKAIDNAPEEEAYNMLDELNATPITSPDQVFDMAKKRFPVDFDVEVFREPFREKVDLKLIKKSIRYANIYRENEKIDAATARSIVKKILLQKEKEFNKIVEGK